MSELHRNAGRVADAAAALGLEIEIRRFPDGTKTAADAAAAIGVEVGQIVKSLIFAVDEEVVMALVSGTNQLDERRLAAAAGGTKAKRVDADGPVRQLATRSAASRRSATPRRCASSSTPICSPGPRCGRPRGHGTTCSA